MRLLALLLVLAASPALAQSFGAAFPATGTPAGAKSSTTGRMQPLTVDGTGALVVTGGGGGGGSVTQGTVPWVTAAGKAATAPLSTAVSVTTSATALPGSALTNRTSLCIYNNGTATIYLGPAGVTTASGLPVPAGGAFCDDVGAQVYYGIVAAGTVEARVLEN